MSNFKYDHGTPVTDALKEIHEENVKQRLRELLAWAGHSNIKEADNTIYNNLTLISDYVHKLESEIDELKVQIKDNEYYIEDLEYDLSKERFRNESL